MAVHLVPRGRTGRLATRRPEWFPSIWEDMDRLLRGPFEALGTVEGEFMPSVDLSETDDQLKVTAELPGMKKEDIDLTVSRDSITIRGEKKEETEDKGKGYRQVERRFGSFQRTIPLPSEVDESKADAEFKNGVLEVRLPKTEEGRKAQKLSIKGE